jgi:hypothetical protein
MLHSLSRLVEIRMLMSTQIGALSSSLWGRCFVMRSTANLTDMPELTHGSLMTTPVFIPQTAGVSFPSTWIGTVFLLHFLLSQNTAFTSAMTLEVMGFEVTELVEFIEGYIVDRPNMSPDSFIKGKEGLLHEHPDGLTQSTM